MPSNTCAVFGSQRNSRTRNIQQWATSGISGRKNSDFGHKSSRSRKLPDNVSSAYGLSDIINKYDTHLHTYSTSQPSQYSRISILAPEEPFQIRNLQGKKQNHQFKKLKSIGCTLQNIKVKDKSQQQLLNTKVTVNMSETQNNW